MVKHTNRIQNLNKMILEYKREQEKFEVIEREIFDQQKEIEDLRLLILSTNFLKHDSSNKNKTSEGNSQNDTKISSKSTKEKRSSGKQMIKRKSKEFQNDKLTNQLTKDKTILQADDLKEQIVGKSTIEIDQVQVKPSISSTKSIGKDFQTPASTAHKPKGLQTISKNLLNQKDNRYSSKVDCKSMKGAKCNLIHTDGELTKSAELLSKINKLKTVNNKFENQENPKECLGINKQSKSIRKTRSAFKSTNKLNNSNRALQGI